MISSIIHVILQIFHDFMDNCCDLFFGGLPASPNDTNENILDPVEVPSQNNGCNDSTSLYWFIRCNAPLFTIIGITGTMLALIPTFLEKFIGSNWVNQLLTNYSGLWILIFVEIVIVCSAIFILLIAINLAFRLWYSNFNQESLHRIGHYEIRRGLIEKILFCIVFYPLIFAFIIFIASIYLFQIDPYLQIIGSLVLAVLYLLLAFLVLFSLIIASRKSRCWKNAIIFLLILLFIGFWIWFITTISPMASQFDPYNNQSYGEVEIIPANLTYSIENSTSIGMPFVIGGYYNNLSLLDRAYYLNFHWTTNYGYFITNDPSDNLVKIQGSDFSLRNSSSTIFWTYDVKDQNIVKPPIIISISVENTRTKKILNGTHLNMHWCEINKVCIVG